jgi:hypothetical protein
MKNSARVLNIIGVALGLGGLALTAFALVYVVKNHSFSRWGCLTPRMPWKERERSMEGWGDRSSEKRSVAPFTSVELKGIGDVHVTQGSEREVTVKARRRVLPMIETEVRGGELVVWDKGFSGFVGPIDIYLTMDSVEGLAVSGSGRIIGEDTISADELSLGISGSGGIAVHVEAERVRTRVTGSGSLTISGGAGVHEALISGSGRIEGFGLETKRCEVKIAGSGRARLNVSDDLNAVITGSGNIEYKGNPRVRQKTFGSGSLLQVD